MPEARVDGAVRVEHDAGVPGLGAAAPRLSWSILSEDPEWAQETYEVELTDDRGEVHTQRVDSAEQVLVPWPFEALQSRARASVRVRLSSAGSWTEFSEPAAVEIGLLDPSDWTARFITPRTFGGLDAPAPLLFSQAQVGPDLASARLYVTAKGSYIFSINGQRVGDEVLAPGWTSYHHRLRYQTHDVTQLLREGGNALQAVLGNGWYRGNLMWDMKRDSYGSRLALLAQLELRYEDGSTEVIGTDASWQVAESNILSDDIYNGQRTDLRIGNDAPGNDGRDCEPVDVLDDDLSVLVAPDGPPVRVTGEQPATNVFRSPSGKLLMDFGQNLVGWVRLTVRGQAPGHEVTVRHAEVLEHGELGLRPLRHAKATDSYLLAGTPEEIMEPQFTFHGFRYAQVDGLNDLSPDDVTAVVIGSDLKRTGWFECSNPNLNQLHENVIWGMRGNFLDVPTDCPQRDERLGWTGDIQVFSPTASFLFDTSGFLSSWLKDLAVDQYADGTVPFVIPDIMRSPDLPATTAWGDAATLVPWVLHERFGDVEVLRQQYPSAKAWVDRIVELAGENHLWEGGFQFGDWLDPTAPPDDPAAAQADPDVVATAYLVRSAQVLSKTAALLRYDSDAKHYQDLADASLQAFRHEYVTGAGRVLSDCQTVYALALVWDLLDREQQSRHAGKRLADLVRTAGFRVSTGFVGTPLILDALTVAGFPQLAYRMLLEKGNPSWLYPVTMGATTIWERWDSMLPDGTINPGQMTSFNHYALGAVADWMHRTIAGLAPAAPGYRRVRIQPLPGGNLSSASATHLSPYGKISVSWTEQGGTFSLHAEIPVGVEAQVWLPGADEATVVRHGRHSWSVPFEPPAIRNHAEELTLAELMREDTLFKPIAAILKERKLVKDQWHLKEKLVPHKEEHASRLLDVLDVPEARRAEAEALIEDVLTS